MYNMHRFMTFLQPYIPVLLIDKNKILFKRTEKVISQFF